MEIISCKNLSFAYRGSKKQVCRNITFSISKGELVLLCGRSGCGKTTLLKLLKKEISPMGECLGEIFFEGSRVSELDSGVLSEKIGFVSQNSDSQIVTDKVSSELAFGLENLGTDSNEMRRRIGETSAFFGIEELYNKDISMLSGGQKQLCSLCSVMVMNPELLILDEPTAQLDPVAAKNFIAALKRLNDELGLTIIIAEHNTEEIFPIANRVLIMDKGKIVSDRPPRETAEFVVKNLKNMQFCIPAAAKIYGSSKKIADKIPLTVNEGKLFAEKNFDNEVCSAVHEDLEKEEPVLYGENLWFRYERSGSDILKGADFKLFRGELFTILGSNGVGKTTLLNVLGGIVKCYRGKIYAFGKRTKDYKNGSLYKNLLAILPQNPYSLFIKDTVREDYQNLISAFGLNDVSEDIISEISEQLGLKEILDRHPFDLSGGEAQKCALGKVLITKPKIILCDEPVKGLDYYSAKEIGELLKALKKQGISILTVTHDIEFAAEFSDRCGLFFDGAIASCDVPEKFFSTNNYYTTAACRIARNVFSGAVTVLQVQECIKRQEEGTGEKKSE